MGGFVFNSAGGVNSFDIGITGLNAARIALQVTGHNIANVNTPGYSRQRAIQQTMQPAFTPFGALGRGTRIVGIDALRDRFLEVQLAVESRELGRLRTTNGILGQIESIYNPVGGVGLTDSVNNFFGGFNDLAANPENIAQRTELLSFAQSLEKHSGETITRLARLKDNLNGQISTTVEEINSVLEQIANLNTMIAGGEMTNRPVEDYRDQRNLLLRQLNELIDVDSFESENGGVTVITGNGVPLVIQEQFAELGTRTNSRDASRLDVYSTFNNSPTNITDMVSSGQLGALLRQRDQTINDLISEQRRFNAILADVVNIMHHRGTDLNGNAGGDFFLDPFNIRDSSAAADILGVSLVGNNATFEVNYDVATFSAASVSAIDIDDASLLTKMDYQLTFTSATGDYQVINTTTGEVAATGTLAGLTATFDGLDVTFDALPANGDTFDLSFAGRTGLTGDVYRIEFTAGGNYQVLNTTTGDSTPVTTGVLGGPGFIFFDGLAVEFDAVPADGDFFTVGYGGLKVNPDLDPEEIAASGAPAGQVEPGNNVNAMRLAELAEEALGGLGNRNFASFQANQISKVGSLKSDAAAMLNSQEIFVDTLIAQRESVSGVSLDEEAAALVEYEQAYQANAQYLSRINDLTSFLIRVLVA
ncbi:MAG TPA: flagellar hook-associated protein FlgK [Acidobacteriota bacterium]|nr:flagellar hook-associated protein FlgK [Acidobacteriota bacterium]